MSVERPVVHVIEIKVEPKSKADEAKMLAALEAMAQADPIFAVSVDPETGEMILKGMGELHLDGKLDQLKRVHGVGFNQGPRVVSYRETLAHLGEAEATFEKTIGGVPHFARVKLRLEPEDLGMANRFVSEMDSDPLWDDYVRGAEAGVREIWERGAHFGFPMVDMKVTLLEVDYLGGDSSAMAFQAAARQAMEKGCKAAGVKQLDPMMAVEVFVPQDVPLEGMARLMTYLDQCRGENCSIARESLETVVRATIPAVNLFGFQIALSQISAGRMSHEMTFSHFGEIPRRIVLPDDDPENFPPAIGMRA